MNSKIEYNKIKQYISDLITAGLESSPTKVELIALSLSRALRKDNPIEASEISETIGKFIISGSHNKAQRAGNNPIPVDYDSQLEMARIHEPNSAPKPILNSIIEQRFNSFIEERTNAHILLNAGIRPSNSLLLIGPSGTGKTMLAKHLASKLNKDLVVLDLSTSISSLLGKTGSNLKKVLDYAKRSNSVLLLDEFDAIAKRRDDSTDLGEIKRIVNVLLMELEDWPSHSILVATSNHAELLDPAIWRRFDHTIEITPPEHNERQELIHQELDSFFQGSPKSDKTLFFISTVLEGKSAADICKYCNNVKRRIILKEEKFNYSALTELANYISDKKDRGDFCAYAKKELGNSISVRDLSKITGLSTSGVQHHINKNL